MSQRSSSITAGEIRAAMEVAHRLGTVVESPARHSIREMEMQQILEAVFDQRADGLTRGLEERVWVAEAGASRAEAQRQRLEAQIEQLEETAAELEQHRRIRRAWAEVHPHIRETSWYRAALAVAELDDALDT